MQYLHVYMSGYGVLLVCGPCDGSPSGGLHHEGRLQARHRIQVRCPHYIQYILHCQLHNYNVHCNYILLQVRPPCLPGSGAVAPRQAQEQGAEGGHLHPGGQVTLLAFSMYKGSYTVYFINGTYSFYFIMEKKSNFSYFCNGTWYSHIFAND